MSEPEAPGAKPAGGNRREFLLKLGAGAGVVALTGQAVASLRSLVPNVSYDAPTTVKLGPTAEFPDGLKFLPDQRLFVFRSGNTFHAISAVCTHLGCTVRAEALSQPTRNVSNLVARLTPTSSNPVAIGSRVPACPTLRVPQIRRQAPTTSWLVMPAGLSTRSRPSPTSGSGGRATV